MKSLAEKLNSLLESVEDPKILAAREKLAKMQKTLERHHTRLAKKESEITKLTDKNDIYWCQCDIDHLKDDIKRTENKISDYQAYLNKIESKAQSEKNKREEFPEIFISFKEELVSRWNEFDKENRDKILKEGKSYYYDQETDEYDWKKYDEFNKMKSLTDEKIEKTNERNAIDLVWNLIHRVKDKVGDIISYDNLHVTDGNYWKDGGAAINGYVEGELGRAEVKSILAIGPIYRAHIRVLVKKI